jgi:uncharacterized membrane protein
MYRKIALSLLIIIFGIISFNKAQNQFPESKTTLEGEEILNAKITKVIKEEEMMFDNREYLIQDLEVLVTSGSVKNRQVQVKTSLTPKFKDIKFKKGEDILIGYVTIGRNTESFYLIDYSRTKPLFIVFALFIFLSIIVGGSRGFYSLLGMAISLVILVVYILPLIINGANPFYALSLGVVLMIPTLFYISHGFNNKTTVAVVGTMVSLIITVVLAKVLTDAAHLTGIIFPEIETLLYSKNGEIDLKGILLAGIMMGSLGVIDDVSMTQASIVNELHNADPKKELKELFKNAMNVGRDHIGSVVNTLILVYVGGSLSTLLLFTQFPRPLNVLLNNEVIALQLAISLVGSIGLIIAIPITTFFAAWIITKHKK